MEPLLSKEEREEFLQKREERLERNYKQGKVIVAVISLTYIIFTVIASIISLNVLGLIINIAAAVALWFGVKWVRVFFAFTVVVNVILLLVVLFNPVLLSTLPTWGLVLSIFQLAFGIISSILLFKNEGVIDFMEYQRESPY